MSVQLSLLGPHRPTCRRIRPKPADALDREQLGQAFRQHQGSRAQVCSNFPLKPLAQATKHRSDARARQHSFYRCLLFLLSRSRFVQRQFAQALLIRQHDASELSLSGVCLAWRQRGRKAARSPHPSAKPAAKRKRTVAGLVTSPRPERSRAVKGAASRRKAEDARGSFKRLRTRHNDALSVAIAARVDAPVYGPMQSMRKRSFRVCSDKETACARSKSADAYAENAVS